MEYPKTRQKAFKNLDERTLIRRSKRHRGTKNVVSVPTRRIVPRADGSEECFGRAAKPPRERTRPTTRQESPIEVGCQRTKQQRIFLVFHTCSGSCRAKPCLLLIYRVDTSLMRRTKDGEVEGEVYGVR